MCSVVHCSRAAALNLLEELPSRLRAFTSSASEDAISGLHAGELIQGAVRCRVAGASLGLPLPTGTRTLEAPVPDETLRLGRVLVRRRGHQDMLQNAVEASLLGHHGVPACHRLGRLAVSALLRVPRRVHPGSTLIASFTPLGTEHLLIVRDLQLVLEGLVVQAAREVLQARQTSAHSLARLLVVVQLLGELAAFSGAVPTDGAELARSLLAQMTTTGGASAHWSLLVLNGVSAACSICHRYFAAACLLLPDDHRSEVARSLGSVLRLAEELP